MNICFEYLYRDGSNYKNWGEAIFKPGPELDLVEVDRQIREVLIGGEYFVAELVNVPTLYFLKHDQSRDHGWHEYSGISWTEKDAENKGTILRFIEELEISRSALSRY